MGPRRIREPWESIARHDDANIAMYALMPVFVFCSALLVYDLTLVAVLKNPWMRFDALLWALVMIAFFGSVMSRLGGALKLLEQVLPPRQVVARRRAPQVYRELLQYSCCRRRPSSQLLPEEERCETGRHNASEHVPALNVLIMVTGTHGDVVPFVALANELRARYGHRIRFATHLIHRNYVMKEGLDFYPLAGDPRLLSQWMVQAQGRLLPDLHAPVAELRQEVSKIIPAKLAMVNNIMESTWPACVDELPEEMAAMRPRFVAHAIISNPVTYGHIHCASALNIPLHMAFPQPWTPTSEYPHPLLRDSGIPNRISFHIVDRLNYMSLNVNQFRTEVLNLPPILGGDRGAHVINQLRVPFSYLWSPALSPKPHDWGEHVEVLGALVQDAGVARKYEPVPSLVSFLQDGPKPVFVGFGSMIIHDPDGLFKMLAEAVARTRVRMIVQSSWSNVGGNSAEIPASIHLIGGCPHSWLLPKCSAVVHHGGAGTVAAGLRFGLPTFVVPFFGDQHFWGDAVLRVGAGPPPCPYQELSADRLVEAIDVLRRPEVRRCAADVADAMSREDGIGAMCDSFTRNLPITDMVCSVSLFAETEPRVVVAEKWHPGAGLKLSQEAHAALQSSPLATIYSCDYGYVLWDTHAQAFVGNGVIMLISHIAQGALDVVLAGLSPFLEGARFARDWHEKGGRGSLLNVVCSALWVFFLACVGVPHLVMERLLQLVFQTYVGVVEYVVRKSPLYSRRLVHVRARHRWVRPAVDISKVPQQRRDDLVRAGFVAEHVLNSVALVQRRSCRKVRSRIVRRELQQVLHILAHCPPPRGPLGRCARALQGLQRCWAYARTLCMREKLEETCLDGWDVGEEISTVDFCLRYGSSIHTLTRVHMTA